MHQKAFSDAEVSFQIAHALVCRCETGFLQCRIYWADLAREVGFEQEPEPLARPLKPVPRQSFSLVRRMAEWKFGPNYVWGTTPINNVRIGSFFAGECEVNVIDPRKVEIKTRRTGKSTYICEQRTEVRPRD